MRALHVLYTVRAYRMQHACARNERTWRSHDMMTTNTNCADCAQYNDE